jgi:hypothetical protein
MLLCTTKLWLNYKDAIHCSPVTSRVDALLSGHKGPGIEAKKNDMAIHRTVQQTIPNSDRIEGIRTVIARLWNGIEILRLKM